MTNAEAAARVRADPSLADLLPRVIVYCAGRRGELFHDIRDAVRRHLPDAEDGAILAECERLAASGYLVDAYAHLAPDLRAGINARMYDLTPTKGRRACRWLELPEL